MAGLRRRDGRIVGEKVSTYVRTTRRFFQLTMRASARPCGARATVSWEPWKFYLTPHPGNLSTSGHGGSSSTSTTTSSSLSPHLRSAAAPAAACFCLDRGVVAGPPRARWKPLWTPPTLRVDSPSRPPPPPCLGRPCACHARLRRCGANACPPSPPRPHAFAARAAFASFRLCRRLRPHSPSPTTILAAAAFSASPHHAAARAIAFENA